MRRDDFVAAAAHALRRLSARFEPASDRAVPMTAVVALIVGMLLSVTLLAATESNAPAVQSEIMEANLVAHRGVTRSEVKAPEIPEESSDSSALPEAALTVHDDPELRRFNNRPIRPVRTIEMIVTAYSPDEQSCGEWADGFTASGYSVWTNGMKLVAADTSILPFGSLVSVPGYDNGGVVPVLDRGGAIKGNRLDVLYPTHERALQWGVQRLEVTIWEYADGQPNGFRQQHHRR